MFIFVGECRSATAQERGWSWADGHLAAKPLFEALRAAGIDPTEQRFVNLFRDPPSAHLVNHRSFVVLRDRAPAVRIVALGKRVAHELARRGLVHIALVHPAARGRIRKRERYIEHVRERLAA
jgi:hypothetical protein